MIVTPAVLIPRMDTEPLVFTALEILKDVPEPRILDLCCGSGCIGCALGVNLPKARVIFADISPEALSVTRKNISLHRLNPRAVALEADALSPPPLRMQNFDLIACNPPYITEEECQALDTSVRDWEPMLALDGGEDGADVHNAVDHQGDAEKLGHELGALTGVEQQHEAADRCSIRHSRRHDEAMHLSRARRHVI